MDAQFHVDEENRTAEWWIEGIAPGSTVLLPWGRVQIGEQSGAGQRVEVEADEPFFLVLHTAVTSYHEHMRPGRHRLLLTVLDRTDVSTEP